MTSDGEKHFIVGGGFDPTAGAARGSEASMTDSGQHGSDDLPAPSRQGSAPQTRIRCRPRDSICLDGGETVVHWSRRSSVAHALYRMRNNCSISTVSTTSTTPTFYSVHKACMPTVPRIMFRSPSSPPASAEQECPLQRTAHRRHRPPSLRMPMPWSDSLQSYELFQGSI